MSKKLDQVESIKDPGERVGAKVVVYDDMAALVRAVGEECESHREDFDKETRYMSRERRWKTHLEYCNLCHAYRKFEEGKCD